MNPETQGKIMSSETLHEATFASGDASPYPEISQRSKTSFLKQFNLFRHHSRQNTQREYESQPSNSEESSVLSPAQIRANQLVTYFNNTLKNFYDDFGRDHDFCGGSMDEYVCPMSFDGHGGYCFYSQFRDGSVWDIYYFEEPMSKDLSAILEEPMEGNNEEKMDLNGMTSQPETAEISSRNKLTNGTEGKEIISTPAVLDEVSNACDNSHYQPDAIEDLVEHYLNPDPRNPDEDISASSVDSPGMARTGVPYRESMTSKSNPVPAESTLPTPLIPPESPTNPLPPESFDNTAILPTEPLSGFKKICFEKFLIHRHLKEVTGLQCIPEIAAWEFVDQEADGIIGADGWVAEDYRHGSQVKITNSNVLSTTDTISIKVNDEWIPLKGRKKQRFLDDLARIHIAYSTITSPHLGPVELTYTNNAKDGTFPYFNLQDGKTSLTADIIPTVRFPKTYFLRLGHRAPPFLKHLASIFPIPQTGPYPLQPPTPIWSHVYVNPKTGNIVRLSNCHKTRSVPWEIAACPPLQLSRPAQGRWIHSLRRHWWGAFIRDRTSKFESRPKLDRMVFSNNLVGLECLLRLQEDSSKEEIEQLERKMVKVLGNGKSHREMKREWYLSDNPVHFI